MQNKDREIKGKKCEVKPAKSRENKKIFVGGLPADYNEEELRKHFEQFGKVGRLFFHVGVFFTDDKFWVFCVVDRRNRMAVR